MKNLIHFIICMAISAVVFTGCCDDGDDPCMATNPDDSCICYEIYAPVCGCDGVTYSNDCYAECVGIMDYTEGPCDEPCVPNNEVCSCPEYWDPVCGCDGVTYSNECFAECVGITDFTPGECNDTCYGEPTPDCICTLQFDPVCGCDGNTYGNECEARCAGILDYTPGVCP